MPGCQPWRASSFQRSILMSAATTPLGRDVQVQRGGGVLGAALGHDPRSAPRGVNLESAVRVEEGRAGADLQDRVGWMYGLAGGDEDLYTRRDRLAGRGVDDGTCDLWHRWTLTCVICASIPDSPRRRMSFRPICPRPTRITSVGYWVSLDTSSCCAARWPDMGCRNLAEQNPSL